MKKIFALFTNNWQSHDPFTKKQKADVIEFMPAALEILEKPASPAGRYLAYSLILLFCIALLWAFFGKVDVVASAEGKLIPSGRVKLIQSLQVGVVKNIFVKEGQLIHAGEPLIELDQTLTGADRDRLRSEMAFIRHNIVRKQALAELLNQPDAATYGDQQLDESILQSLAVIAKHNALELSVEDTARQRAMVLQAWREYRSQAQMIHSQLHSKQSALQGAQASIQKFESTIPLVSKRVDALRQLHDSGMGAEVQLLELQENQITQQQNLAAELSRAEQIRADISEVTYSLAAQKNNALKVNLEEIEQLTQQLGSSQQELNKANELYTKKILTSPVTGRVKQLAVHTIGGIVEEAKVLMQIVPEEGFLEVEAVLQNKDIGFISKGQRAEVKIHTFPFTKYGLVDAEVIDITADAIETEKQGLVYSVRLKVDQTQLWVDTKWVELLPGMEVTVEVKTNKRRVIEFFLSPLLRYKDESIRER
ncbi:MAG: hemolysin D [Lentisphaeria bacterium]|jgi:hemolysin D